MEEIKLNLENLSKEEREQLMKLVEKANKPKVRRWKPAIYEAYFYINNGSDISHGTSWTGDSFDNARFSRGNVFKTEEEAQFALEKLKVEVELQDVADELNEGWEPDWSDNSCKYYLCYNYMQKSCIYTWAVCSKGKTIYFKNETIAEEAIKRIGEERLKKYFFGVE